MKKKYLKHISGLTLIEIMIGIVVSSLMMAAMYTTYSIVNTTYSQVTNKAQISRSSRDLIELLIRDVRMSGFKYYLGQNTRGYPDQSYLQFKGGATTVKDSHDPIVIIPNSLGHSIGDTIPNPTPKHDVTDLCCDKIHVVFDDFDHVDQLQPYKRYKVTYYAKPVGAVGQDPRYAIYKSKISWQQKRGNVTEDFPPTGTWVADCSECYHDQLVRDYVEDMEFIALDREGRRLTPPPSPTSPEGRNNLYKIRSVDIKIAFRSENEFYRFDARPGKERPLSGFARTIKSYSDRYLRDTVVISVYTRNILDDGLF